MKYTKSKEEEENILSLINTNPIIVLLEILCYKIAAHNMYGHEHITFKVA